MSSMVFASLHRWWSYKHLLLYHNDKAAELKEFFLDLFSGRAIFSCRRVDSCQFLFSGKHLSVNTCINNFCAVIFFSPGRLHADVNVSAGSWNS